MTFNEELADFVNGDLGAVVDKLRDVQQEVRKRDLFARSFLEPKPHVRASAVCPESAC